MKLRCACGEVFQSEEEFMEHKKNAKSGEHYVVEKQDYEEFGIEGNKDDFEYYVMVELETDLIRVYLDIIRLLKEFESSHPNKVRIKRKVLISKEALKEEKKSAVTEEIY